MVDLLWGQMESFTRMKHFKSEKKKNGGKKVKFLAGNERFIANYCSSEIQSSNLLHTALKKLCFSFDVM